MPTHTHTCIYTMHDICTLIGHETLSKEMQWCTNVRSNVSALHTVKHDTSNMNRMPTYTYVPQSCDKSLQ